MLSRFCIILVATNAFALLQEQTFSKPIKVRFSGQWTGVPLFAREHFSVGDSFDGSFTFKSTTPGDSSALPDGPSILYGDAITIADVSFGNGLAANHDATSQEGNISAMKSKPLAKQPV